MITRADYWRAQIDLDPSYRQWFVEKIDLGRHKKYVSLVSYNPENIKVSDKTLIMKTALSPLELSGKKHSRSEIEVYPSAFLLGVHPFLNDFVGTLEHETFHAREFYNNTKRIKTMSEQEKIESEINALTYQLERAGRRRHSSIYVMSIKEALEMNVRNLQRLRKQGTQLSTSS